MKSSIGMTCKSEWYKDLSKFLIVAGIIAYYSNRHCSQCWATCWFS